MFEIKFNPYSQAEYDGLDGSQKIFIDKGIQRIRERGMIAGEALKGGLIGCNKLKNKSLGLRIVFREVLGVLEIIEIVAIGKRDKKRVYNAARERIGDKESK